MFGSSTPNRRSRKRMSDVWSNTCEFTHPPLLQGEITIIGTRTPSPYGPGVKLDAGYPEEPVNNSLVVPTVEKPCARDMGGVGGTTWSKKPSFSSYMRKNTVLLQTSGFAVSASSICETYHAPKFGGQFPCSVYASGATIHDTCGS